MGDGIDYSELLKYDDWVYEGSYLFFDCPVSMRVMCYGDERVIAVIKHLHDDQGRYYLAQILYPDLTIPDGCFILDGQEFDGKDSCAMQDAKKWCWDRVH